MQYCMRPSDSSAQDSVLPIGVLADVNTVMDSLRSDMATILARECIDMGGTWTNDINADKYMDFYNETNANEKWGVCTVQ